MNTTEMNSTETTTLESIGAQIQFARTQLAGPALRKALSAACFGFIPFMLLYCLNAKWFASLGARLVGTDSFLLMFLVSVMAAALPVALVITFVRFRMRMDGFDERAHSQLVSLEESGGRIGGVSEQMAVANLLSVCRRPIDLYRIKLVLRPEAPASFVLRPTALCVASVAALMTATSYFLFWANTFKAMG